MPELETLRKVRPMFEQIDSPIMFQRLKYLGARILTFATIASISGLVHEGRSEALASSNPGEGGRFILIGGKMVEAPEGVSVPDCSVTGYNEGNNFWAFGDCKYGGALPEGYTRWSYGASCTTNDGKTLLWQKYGNNNELRVPDNINASKNSCNVVFTLASKNSDGFGYASTYIHSNT